MSEEERRREFEREFLSYWNHCVSRDNAPLFFSLVTPNDESREIVYHSDEVTNTIVLADDQATLMQWLRNTGRNVESRHIQSSWLVWLEAPPMPSEFPKKGRDVLKLLPQDELGRLLSRKSRCPILLGVKTPTGRVLAGTVLKCGLPQVATKGFRVRNVPISRIISSVAGQPILRCRVERVDGRWVHSRDHGAEFDILANKRVAIVGCGALGAAIGRILAQAGVGRVDLIDHDNLAPQNTSRHVLGHRFVGRNKAAATARMLRQDFPHMKEVIDHTATFTGLRKEELENIASVDVMVSAGIRFEGDVAIDQWRRACSVPPAHVCTWVEEFAIVGHAIAILGHDSLLTGFDDEGVPVFRVTRWSDESESILVEAGCGNTFQPHGVTDLQPTVGLASRLVLDVLLNLTSASCRRVWYGDLERVSALKGTLIQDAAVSFVIKEYPWS